MKMSKPEYVPLSDLNPAVCNLPLPEYVDATRIGVDMRHIGVIAAWGGFKSDVRIISVDGETSSYSVGITGQNGGSATATGAGAVTRVPTSESLFSPEQSEGFRRVPSLTLQLNGAEMTDRIQRKKQPVREPKVWATQADHALRRGLFNAAWKNMVGTTPGKRQKALDVTASGYALFNILIVGSGDVAARAVALSIPTFVQLGLINITTLRQVTRENVTLRESHLSIVPLWHVDRALLATGALGRRVVKAI